MGGVENTERRREGVWKPRVSMRERRGRKGFKRKGGWRGRGKL